MSVDETLLRSRAGIKPRSLSPSEIGEARPVPGSFREPEPAAPSPVKDPDYQPPHKKSDPLPRPGDAYRACARFLNRLSVEQKLLHFVTRNFACEGYAYSDLRRLRW